MYVCVHVCSVCVKNRERQIVKESEEKKRECEKSLLCSAI